MKMRKRKSFLGTLGRSCALRKNLALLLIAMSTVNGLADPLVIAHRGASKAAPENTRSALVAAVEQKAPIIEFDVRETKDGKLVLFHDDSLERVAGKKGSIESGTWKEVADLDVGKWFGDGKFAGEKPMLLEEALEFCVDHDIVALVEHKSGSPQNYAKVIRALNSPQHVIVQSFQWGFLKGFQEEVPGIPIGALGSKELSSEKLGQIEAFRPTWVGWKHSDLSQSNLEKLQEAGFRVALWTVNKTSDARPWIARGVDAIITDVPAVMLGLLEEGAPKP